MILFPNRIALFLLPTKNSPYDRSTFSNVPHCFEEISMLVDPSVKAPRILEDASPAAHPLRSKWKWKEGEINVF